MRHFLSVFSVFPGKVAQLVKCKREICVLLLNLLTLSNFLKAIVICTSAISHDEALFSANIMSAHLTFLRIVKGQRSKERRNFLSSFTMRSHHSQYATLNGRVSGVQPSTLRSSQTFSLSDDLPESSLRTNMWHQITVSGLQSWSFWGRRYKNLICIKDVRYRPIPLFRQQTSMLKSTRNGRANPIPLRYWFSDYHCHDPSL